MGARLAGVCEEQTPLIKIPRLSSAGNQRMPLGCEDGQRSSTLQPPFRPEEPTELVWLDRFRRLPGDVALPFPTPLVSNLARNFLRNLDLDRCL